MAKLKSLSIQYHTAVLNVFKPMLYLEQSKDSTRDAISDLLVKHAKEGFACLVRYCRMYGAAYQTPIQLYCLVHICDAVMTHDRRGQSKPEAIRFCMEVLEEAKQSYPLAKPLQHMFAAAVNECNISLPDDLERLLGSNERYQVDELLNACTRLTYRTPIDQLKPNLEPTLADDFIDEWQRASKEEMNDELESPTSFVRQDNQRSMNISSLLNDD